MSLRSRSFLPAALLAILCGGSAFAAEVGASAPAFTLPDLKGDPHSLSDHAGKIVVLEWFNSECPWTRKVHEEGVVAATIQGLGSLDHDVIYLTINSTATGADGAQTAEHVTKVTRDYLVDRRGYPGLPVLIDHDGTVGRAYGARTTPHCFVIDGKGKLRYEGAYVGDREDVAGSTNHVLQAVQQIAAGEAVKPNSTKPWGCGVKYGAAPAATAQVTATNSKAEIGQPAPNFTLTDTSGKEHSLSDYKGRTVVIEWFCPTCPWCLAIYGDGRVESALAGMKEVDDKAVYIAVNSTHQGKSREVIIQESVDFMAQHEQDSVSVLIDHDGKVGKAYQAKVTPHMFVIDGDGILRYSGAFSASKRGNSAEDEAGSYVLGAVTQIAKGEKVVPNRTKPWG